MKKPILISTPRGGLGSRLIGLGCAMEFAKIYNLPMKVWWAEGYDICDLPHLFAPNDRMKGGNLFTYLGPALREGTCSILNVGSLTDKDFAGSKNPLADINNYEYILHQKGMMGWYPDFTLSMLNLLKEFPPQPRIVRNADTFCETWDVKNSIAVHVRRGDIDWKPEFKNRKVHIGRLVRIEEFHKKIEKLGLQNEKIILATESNLVEIEFKDRYPNCIRLPATTNDQNRPQAIVEAFVSILIMSKAKKILASESGFSLAAAKLTGIPLIQVGAKVNWPKK